MRLLIAFLCLVLSLSTVALRAHAEDDTLDFMYTRCQSDADCGRFSRCLPERHPCSAGMSCVTNICRSIICWHDSECISLLGREYTCQWFMCKNS